MISGATNDNEASLAFSLRYALRFPPDISTRTQTLMTTKPSPRQFNLHNFLVWRSLDAI